jgi:hypothetical protein
MTYPPHDDRLRHLIAQEINPHVASWKLAFFIANGIVTSREVRGELKRIAEAHAAAEHCGDRNCEHCWTASVTAEDPAPVLPEPADRAAILREAAEVAVRAARGCGDSETGQYAASVAAGIGKELRRMAGEAQQPETQAEADCTYGEGPGDGSGCIKPAGHDGDHAVTPGVTVVPCAEAATA